MTYLELYKKATKLVDSGEITIGEYEKIIEPLNAEIAEWIPVSERLPKDETGVLVYDYDRVCDVATIGNDSLVTYNSNGARHWIKHDFVTHWMPLPSPPKKPARFCLYEGDFSFDEPSLTLLADGTLEQCEREREKRLANPHGYLILEPRMAGDANV